MGCATSRKSAAIYARLDGRLPDEPGSGHSGLAGRYRLRTTRHGGSPMLISNAKEKFVHELADIYDAEHQFLDALQKMQQQASDEKLKGMLEEHATQTKDQISRLEQVFSEVGQSPERQPCSG